MHVAFKMYVHVQVSINGYFLMGEVPLYSSLNDINIPGSSSYSFVAPFAADIDTTRTGSVKYTQFITSDSSQMNTVSSFIRSQTDDSFYGTRMMVAEWNGVPQYQGSRVSLGRDVQYYHNNLLHGVTGRVEQREREGGREGGSMKTLHYTVT